MTQSLSAHSPCLADQHPKNVHETSVEPIPIQASEPMTQLGPIIHDVGRPDVLFGNLRGSMCWYKVQHEKPGWPRHPTSLLYAPIVSTTSHTFP